MFLLTCGSHRIFAANLFYGKALAAKHSAGFFAKLPGESAGNFDGSLHARPALAEITDKVCKKAL